MAVKDFAPGDHISAWSEGKSYAEYFTTPAKYAMKLRPQTRLDEALGEPIACSVNGVLKADPQLNDSVAIIGCGFMGLIMAQVFRARGVGMLIAVDLQAHHPQLSPFSSARRTRWIRPPPMSLRPSRSSPGGAGWTSASRPPGRRPRSISPRTLREWRGSWRSSASTSASRAQ